jgi:hypothetical protein
METKMKTEFNLELASERASARFSSVVDITAPTRMSTVRSIESFRNNPRNIRRPSGSSTPLVTQESIRIKSRSAVLAAFSGAMQTGPEVGDTFDYSYYDYTGCRESDFRWYFLRTTSGQALIKMLMNDSTTVGRKVLEEISGACPDVASRIGRRGIEHALRAYVSMREELFARVEKTGDFTNLIQRQERLLLRISTTVTMAVEQGAKKGSVTTAPFYALLREHLRTVHIQHVPEIQQTAFLLDLLIEYFPWGIASGTVHGGAAIVKKIEGENILKKLVYVTQWAGQFESNLISPDD